MTEISYTKLAEYLKINYNPDIVLILHLYTLHRGNKLLFIVNTKFVIVKCLYI